MLVLTYTMMQMHIYIYSPVKTLLNVTQSCATWSTHPHTYTEDSRFAQTGSETERVSLPSPTSTTIPTPFDQLCISTCSQRQTGTQREISTHRHKHISQPTPAWTHSCAAGLSFSVCDVLPEASSRGALPCWRRGSGVTESLPSSLLAGVSKDEGQVDDYFLSLSNNLLHSVQLPTHDSLNMRNTLYANDNYSSSVYPLIKQCRCRPTCH